MKKRILIGFVLVVLLLLVCGCSNNKKQNHFQVYYMNMDVTKVVPVSYETSTTEVEALASELLGELSSSPKSSDLRKTIPDKVNVLSCKRSGNLLVVDFNSSYYDMTTTEEVLARAAIVRTLTQIETVYSVMFTVESQPLTDANGNVVGSMSSEDFVENPGEQINSSLKTTLTLYFSNKDGTKLVKETRDVYYSSNIALEKLVVEQLIEGPTSSGVRATIPSATQLITISVADEICYVNFDEAFQNQDQTITEPVVVYSIVNSLTELPGIEKVQISINGSSNGKCRFNYDLSTLYEENEEYIE